MKKVKTILAGIVMALGCTFVTACSCSNTSNPTDIIHVYETGISITSDAQDTVVDEETGFLTIRVHKGDDFKITYNISPDNTTTTQVDWGFDGRDDVVASKNNSYSYSQSVSHTITFVAKNKGNTVLKFATKATGKWTQATIIVGDAPEVLPTFLAPTDLEYNATTGKLSWTPVTRWKTYTGVEMDSTVSVYGYEVRIKNLDTGAELEPITVDKCEFDFLANNITPRGVSYLIKVVAKGDNGYTVKDSPASTEYKFHQLDTVSELKNNNGVITFKTPIHSYENRIYFNESDQSMFVSLVKDSTSSVQNCNINYSSFESRMPSLDAYNINVVSYPAVKLGENNFNQFNESTGLGYLEDVNTGIKYFPSIKSVALDVQKLQAPTVLMSHIQGESTVNDTVFGIDAEVKPHLSSAIEWRINKAYEESKYNVKFGYSLYKGDTKILPLGAGAIETKDAIFNITEQIIEKASSDYTGNYTFKIYTLGNSTNTIPSQTIEFEFNIVGVMNNDGTSLSENVLTTSTADFIIGGADLYFINTTDATKSKYVFVNAKDLSSNKYNATSVSYDVSTLNLAPGKYNVYAKYVGVNGAGDGTSTTTATGKLALISATNTPIEVSSPVDDSSLALSSDGVIKFRNVTGVNKYKITLVQARGNITDKTTVVVGLAENNENYSLTNIYRSNNNLAYTQVDGYNYISVYDIIANKLLETPSIDHNNLDLHLRNYLLDANFNFTVIAKGVEQNGVDSASSKAVRFSQTPNISDITLANYELSFANVGSNVKYVVEVNGHKTNPLNGANGTVKYNLNDILEADTNIPLATYASKDSTTPTEIKISAIGVESRINSEGLLNSYPTITYFNTTATPTILSANVDGMLRWKAVAGDGNRNFDLQVYKTDGTNIDTIKISATKLEEADPEHEGFDIFEYDLTNLITSTYETLGNSIVLGFGLEETDSTKFTGEESNKYYVVRLPEVTMGRGGTNAEPTITFAKLQQISAPIYNFTLFKDGEELAINTKQVELLPEEDRVTLSLNTFIKKILEGGEEDSSFNKIGKYTITLTTGTATTGENSKDNPLVLTSLESSTQVEIISSLIGTSVKGENVSWQSINSNATYEVLYKVAGTDDYISAGSDFNSANTTFAVGDIFVAGNNYVKVKPTIDYINTGIILTFDPPQENTVIRLNNVSNVVAQEGQINFRIENDITVDSYSVLLYIDSKLVPSDYYTITTTEIVDGENPENNYMLYKLMLTRGDYTGELSCTFKVTSTGYIDSVVNETPYVFTKVTTPTAGADFVKNGEWIEWYASEEVNEIIYSLNFVALEGGSATTKNLKYTSSNHQIAVEDNSGDTVVYNVNEEVAKVVHIDTDEDSTPDTYKIMYKFNELENIGDVAGTYKYNITPYVTEGSYLNGNKSGDLTIVKLSDNVTIKASGESIALNGYVPTGTPVSMQYVIKYYTITEIPAEGENPARQEITYGNEYTSEEISYESIKDLIESTESAYLINLNEITDDQNKQLFTMAGNYEISVVFIGNGNELLSSKVKTDNTLIKLETTNLKTDKGVVVWNAIDGATSYTVKVYADDVEPVMIEAVEPSLTDEVLGEFKFEVGKNYNLELMANGASLSSKWSEVFVVKKLLAPTELVIEATNEKVTYTDANSQVITINVGDPILRWSNPNTVSSEHNFALNYGDGSDEIIIHNVGANSNEFLGQLLPKDKDAGDYIIKLRIIGNTTTGTNQIGLLTSNYSGEDVINQGDGTTPVPTSNPTAKYVYDVDNIRMENNTYTWNAVEGAYAYKISFYTGMTTDDLVAVEYVSTNLYNFRNSEFADYGYHTIMINAITDPKIAIVTTKEFEGDKPFNNTNVLYRTENVKETFVYNGQLAWMLSVYDVQTLLAPHETNDNSAIKLAFADDPTISSLAEKVIKYMMVKINNGGDSIAEVDSILTHLYQFRLKINDSEMNIMPTSMNVARITTDGEEKTYNFITGSFLSTDYLLFTYDLITNREGSTIDSMGFENYENPGKYEIYVSPVGNMLPGDMATGNITTTDGRYVDKLVAYKPNTPKTWTDREHATQIADGQLLWTLVTNDDSTIDQYYYHKQYTIRAISNSNSDSFIAKDVSVVDENIVEDTENYCVADLKELFTTGQDVITTNQNYTIEINVKGTTDSTILEDGEKAYFNSNVFKYTDMLNVLANHKTEVRESQLIWDPCADSTATRVVIYGPFDYAPREEDCLDNDDYIAKLTEWKQDIATNYMELDDETGALEFKSEYVDELMFRTDEEGLRLSKYTLTNGIMVDNILSDVDYSAGSYIIRKQEIGNGRGVISTEYNDALFVKEGLDPTELEYGIIATKLEAPTQVEAYNSWIRDGMFTWEPVANANAYEVILQKINKQGDVIASKPAEIVKFDTNMPENAGKKPIYEMPNDLEYNDTECTYNLRIRAMHIETDNSLSYNYFTSDETITQSYGRAPIPTGVAIDGDGLATWDQGVSNENIAGYQVKVNNDDAVPLETVGKNTKQFDLSTLNPGTIPFYVRSLGIQDKLNSCFTPYIEVTKLADPETKVKQGIFEWGTSAVDINGENPTNTMFELKLEDELKFASDEEGLPYTMISYPIYTQLDRYEDVDENGNLIYTYDYEYDYLAELDATNGRPAGNYTFRVKFKGDEGETTTGTNFNIASGWKELTATKLHTPVLENRAIDLNNTEAGDKIVWNGIKFDETTYTSHYRAVVFGRSGETEFNKTFQTQDENASDYYVFNADNTVELKLSKIVEEFKADGQALWLKIYVQAIGTLDSEELADDAILYLNSSYSEPIEAFIPSSPVNASWDADSGTISWQLVAGEQNTSNNALITMSYKVLGVEFDDFEDYWKKTADMYRLNGAETYDTVDGAKEYRLSLNPGLHQRKFGYSERIIEQGTPNERTVYDLTVIDVAYVTAKETIDGKTPTSYQLHNIGTDYTFSIVITVGNAEYAGMYRSEPLPVNSINGNPINFQTFTYGDGSTLMPYKVASEIEFRKIKYFMSSHFVLTNSIELKETTYEAEYDLSSTNTATWRTLTETFTGSIDGNGYGVTNIVIKEASRIKNAYSENEVVMALFAKNAGTIKNLNISINYAFTTSVNHQGIAVKLAGLAVYNETNARIENVNVATMINGAIRAVVNAQTNGTKVAGLVVENNGTIVGSSVTVGNISENQVYGIYASDASNSSSYVAGIAVFNNGTITTTSFEGDLKSNYVAGIANVNNGTIERCSSAGNAMVSDMKQGSDIGSKGFVFGGIVGTINSNSKVYYSYSHLTVIITKLSSNTTGYVGAFAGIVVNNLENAEIKGSYALVRIYHDGASGSQISSNTTYAFMPEVHTTACTMEDNYYLVDATGDNVVATNSNITNVGVTAVASKTALNETLATLLDDGNKAVYNTTGEYPVFA